MENDEIKGEMLARDIQFHSLSSDMGLEPLEKPLHKYMYTYDGDKSFYEYIDDYKFDNMEVPRDNIHNIKIKRDEFFKGVNKPEKVKELLSKYRKGLIWKDL